MSKKAVMLPPSVESTDQHLHEKAQLAIKAVDSLMFQGQVGSMVAGLAGMIGIPKVSIGLILPEKKPANLKPFLVSLNSIIKAALDERVEFTDFVPQLAEAIKEIQRIAAEEKE